MVILEIPIQSLFLRRILCRDRRQIGDPSSSVVSIRMSILTSDAWLVPCSTGDDILNQVNPDKKEPFSFICLMRLIVLTLNFRHMVYFTYETVNKNTSILVASYGAQASTVGSKDIAVALKPALEAGQPARQEFGPRLGDTSSVNGQPSSLS